MKPLLIAAALSIGAMSPALADMPGADWMTKEQIIQKLQSLGYNDVRKLEADDGHWEGDALKDGVTYEVHVDPHNGNLTKNEPKHHDHDDD